MRNVVEYTLFSGVTPVSITSSTDATPIVVTATAHGFNVGDTVQIFGHTTNVAANGIYRVKAATANTFTLGDRYTNADVAGSGAGAGSSGVVVKSPIIVLAEDFRYATLQVESAGTSTWTAKLCGSQGIDRTNEPAGQGDTPSFGATQNKSNPYTFLSLTEADANTSGAGNTGIATAGTDINKTYALNILGIKYLNLMFTAWTQGSITAKIQLYNN